MYGEQALRGRCAVAIEFEEPGPGQESAWDYPRPPQLETTERRIVVTVGDTVIADSTRAIRYLETSHPPGYFVPRDDVQTEMLVETPAHVTCEWRGEATCYTIETPGATAVEAAIAFLDPKPGYSVLKDYIAFYAGRVSSATVDGEQVTPQEGNYYTGWITSDVVGPFKGAPGTINW